MDRLASPWSESTFIIQYISVIAWVFDFRKFITITDVSLQPMYIACSPIVSIRSHTTSQHGLSHQRYTKYLIPLGFRVLFETSFSLIHRYFFLHWPTEEKKNCGAENSKMSSTGLLSYHYRWYFLCRIWWFDFSIPIVIGASTSEPHRYASNLESVTRYI